MSGNKNSSAATPPDTLRLSALQPDRRNANRGTDRGREALQKSLLKLGAGRSILLDREGRIIAGNKTAEAAAALGMENVVVVPSDGTTIIAVQRMDLDLEADAKARELAYADNRVGELSLDWDVETVLDDLASGLDIADLFRRDDMAELLADLEPKAAAGEKKEAARQTLAERFLVPPFTVLDARQGYWQARKRAWLELGIKGELGRGVMPAKAMNLDIKGGMSGWGSYVSPKEGKGSGVIGGSPLPLDRKKMEAARSKRPVANPREYINGVLASSDSGWDPQYYYKKREVEERLGRALSTEEFQELYYSGPEGTASFGTSIFDPVLAELLLRWFTPAGGLVIDPTAGGVTRGAVAAHLGYRYKGVELRAEQIEANQAQAATMGLGPEWILGDGRNIFSLVGEDADFVLSCPPYHDLEVYSDDPSDLSNMEWEEFLDAYRVMVAESVRRLKPNRFACFVVGDVRDKSGLYRNFVGETVRAFADAGAALYNEAILVTSIGSTSVRVSGQFGSNRKLGKTHQNVLIFVKGDPKRAVEACGDVEVPSIAEMFKADDELAELSTLED